MTPTEFLDDAMWRMSDVMRSIFARRLQAFGLTPPLVFVLKLLDRPRPMRSLADELLFDPSYVTSLVDTLEMKGLAERRADPSDRRVKLIALTPAGSQLRQQLHVGLCTGLPGFNTLTDEDRITLATLLMRAVTTDESSATAPPTAS